LHLLQAGAAHQRLADPVWSPLPIVAGALDWAPAQTVPVVD
jgi:hypothetical protein